MSEKYFYEAEDCTVVHLGEIKLTDGRIYNGAIVTFPVSPPKLPISVVWNGVPVRIVLKASCQEAEPNPPPSHEREGE